MSMNKTWAISSWISFLTSAGIWIETEMRIADTRNFIASRREQRAARCSKQRNNPATARRVIARLGHTMPFHLLTRGSELAQDRQPNDLRFMSPNAAKNFIVRNAFLCAAAIAITSCGTATFSKTGIDARIESLRSFQLSFIDEFAVPGKRFNAAAFEARVNEGNAKFQQAIAEEKFTARRPVLNDLAAQFKADAAHIRSKASRGKVTSALASEMKKDTNKIYDHALGR